MKLSLSTLKSAIDNFNLFKPEYGSSLALWRILFGFIMGAEAFNKYISYCDLQFAPDRFHFTFPFAEWVFPWPGDGMYVHIVIMGISAFMVSLGLFYRLSNLIFAFCYTWIFLLEKTNYNNHYYLISMVGWIMVFLDGHAVASMDNLIRNGGKRTQLYAKIFGNVLYYINEGIEKLLKYEPRNWVPRWNYLFMQTLMLVVYFYGALAKMNPDWLAGEPVREWYGDKDDTIFIGHILKQEWFVWFIAYTGLLFDAAIGFVMMHRKTRVLGLFPLFGFHLFNHWILNIGVFPFTMMAASILYFPGDTVAKWFGGKITLSKNQPFLERTGYQKRVLWVVGVIIFLQLVIPLRHKFIPGNVNWTEEGHNFAWHMKLRDKTALTVFKVVDPATGQEYFVNQAEDLYNRQIRKISTRPQSILQYAHYLGRKYKKEKGIQNPEVYAEVIASLNGRPFQWLIDPHKDLMKERYRFLTHNDWILQLDPDLPIGLYPKHPAYEDFPPKPPKRE